MPENKQYVTQPQENGNVMISEDVIATIIAQAAKEVDGVVSLTVKPGVDISDMINVKNWVKGMKIIIDENTDEYDRSSNLYLAEGKMITLTGGHAIQKKSKK